LKLDAQYDASQAYIRSQAHAGWTLLRGKYDDGGFSGVNGLIEDWYGEELGYVTMPISMSTRFDTGHFCSRSFGASVRKSE
jgi:hypothetical protein